MQCRSRALTERRLGRKVLVESCPSLIYGEFLFSSTRETWEWDVTENLLTGSNAKGQRPVDVAERDEIRQFLKVL